MGSRVTDTASVRYPYYHTPEDTVVFQGLTAQQVQMTKEGSFGLYIAPKRLIVGLALPEDFEEEPLGPPPERIFYKGLTKFLVIEEGQAIPEGLAGWARRAYEEALSSDGLQ